MIPTVFAAVGTVLVATYGAVFLAEIVGDKLLYTTGILATRYRAVPIMLGVALAFMAKMGVAVMVGAAISRLPKLIVAAVTTVSFLGVAYTLWRKPQKTGEGKKREEPTHKALLVSFAAVFFSEWGDVGQITAATMAARFAAPLAVWIGAVLAMITKGMLAAFLGAGVRQWIRDRVSPQVIRYAGVGLLLLLGVLSVMETLTGGEIG
jgi:Ca2+/H+ antiporter, TMEM165/GDT1 family